jgi:hypothetical protein
MTNTYNSNQITFLHAGAAGMAKGMNQKKHGAHETSKKSPPRLCRNQDVEILEGIEEYEEKQDN